MGGYIYVMMGVIISSCVVPATLTLVWKDQNWIAAACAPLLGLATSLIAWLVTAKSECGELSVACTGSNYPMLAGNVAALLWPMPLYGSGYVFSKPFFTGWVVVGFIWLFCTLLCVGVFPVWQSRATLFKVTMGLLREATGQGRPAVVKGREVDQPEKVDVAVKGEDEKA